MTVCEGNSKPFTLFFFYSVNATRMGFFGQPENKITKTGKSGKIAPIVFPSTAMYTCCNRPKNKNARSNNSLSRSTFSLTLIIKRCAFLFFTELFLAVKQLAKVKSFKCEKVQQKS